MKKLQYFFFLFIVISAFMFCVRSYFFTPFIVKGSSMQPSLRDGDKLIVNQVAYNFVEMERFDVVVIKLDDHTNIVKRVIGLPGDHIRYENDQLYVNNQLIDEQFLTTSKEKYHNWNLTVTEDFTLKNVTSTTKVPKNHIFVLGDNRRNSADSREYGYFPLDKIIGKVELVYYPFSELKTSIALKSN